MERNGNQIDSLGPKSKKSLKSRRNQKLIKAISSLVPQEFGEIVKLENMKDYNPIVLDSIAEENKEISENSLKIVENDNSQNKQCDHQLNSFEGNSSVLII